ncbi:MAG: hypothetical protein VX998_08835 [Candidatus Thermoplasmatota archaeon]|jgi:hypothetical protein|nr:hypothetical protein [Candidatus Thermoplasmatota archaeon]MEC8589735.1 hypothetical protein [Candidatus Thermoplasmatota archaeon]
MKATSLDDYLDGFSSFPKRRNKRLAMLREAYTYGVPGMITKSMTDRLAQSGHYTFHIGTPDPEMRRIASWMLTHENNRTTIAKFIPKIWKRGGREDLKLVGLLLANMSDEELGENGWTVFLQLVQDRVSVEVFLETAEEFLRGGRELPDDAWIRDAAAQSKTWAQLMILLLSLDEKRTANHENLLKETPNGGELLERIRHRLIQRLP